MPNASRPRRPSSIAGLFRVAPLAAMLALYTLAAALFVFTVTGTGAGAVDPEPLAFETRTVTTISMPTAVHTAVFEIWSGVEASGFPASPTPTPAVPTATQAVSALPTRRNEATSTPIGASRRLKKRIFGLWAEQDKAIEEASGSAQVVEKIQPEASDDIHAVTFQSNNSDDIPIGASEGSEPDYYGTEVSTDDMINNEARRLAKRAICDAYCRFALQQSRSSSLAAHRTSVQNAAKTRSLSRSQSRASARPTATPITTASGGATSSVTPAPSPSPTTAGSPTASATTTVSVATSVVRTTNPAGRTRGSSGIKTTRRGRVY